MMLILISFTVPMKRGPPVGPPGPKRGRYEQAPPHRVQKYPQHMPTQPSHGPLNHAPAQQPNYNNSYHNAVPPVQHQSNYYGHHGNGNQYDQSAAPIDQYSPNYNAPPAQTGYNSNGYSQSGGYSQAGYQQPSEYDQSQYTQDYK